MRYNRFCKWCFVGRSFRADGCTGGNDAGRSTITDYKQIPEDALYCHWIKNYGDGPDSDECVMNRDDRTYCPDYSDEHKVK